jgi:hypothetical protein
MQRVRRKTALRHGRIVPILVAAGFGYLIGAWSAQAVRSAPAAQASAPSAAQMVALRFPQDLNIAEPQTQQPAPAAENTMVVGSTELALFEPEPMVPHPAMVPAPQPSKSAAVDPAPPPAPASVPLPARPALVGVAKPRPAVAHVASRPGYLLDDAQIAGIKRRLHLTPEQEEMWPAVESALRHIAFAKARDAHRRGGSLDPNSTEVQDLKSAAIPLLMSFSSEQKDEVRNLAHVMGLDQLASQF